jgi:hypothetical protein
MYRVCEREQVDFRWRRMEISESRVNKEGSGEIGFDRTGKTIDSEPHSALTAALKDLDSGFESGAQKDRRQKGNGID